MYRVRGQILCEDCCLKQITGEAVTVAVLDTGVAAHPDFDNRIIAFRDFVNGRNRMYDDSSHGTHVCGIIGGSGYVSEGRYRGVAPGCRMVVGKVLDQNGEGNIEDMVNGIDWILQVKDELNIRILNISVGTGKMSDGYVEIEAMKAVEKAWKAGLVVVAAAGNAGPAAMTISAVGASNLVITVGCHEGGFFGNVEGLCENYSGRGPTRYALKKPDVVAPGTDIISCNSQIRYQGVQGRCRNAYQKKSGTSMATPIVTGACALLLQKYPFLTNEEVKRRLNYSATDLKESWSKQGWGMVNVQRMLE